MWVLVNRLGRVMLAVVMLIAIASAPSAVAAADGRVPVATSTGPCEEEAIPDDFVMDACFDGSTLTLSNNTAYVLYVDLSGDVTGQRREIATDVGRGLSEQKAAKESGENVLPPGWRLIVELGSSPVTVSVTVWGDGSGDPCDPGPCSRSYAVDNLFDDVVADSSHYGNIETFIRRVSEAASEYEDCVAVASNHISLAACELRLNLRAQWAATVLKLKVIYEEVFQSTVGGLISLTVTLAKNWFWWVEYASGVPEYFTGTKQFTIDPPDLSVPSDSESEEENPPSEPAGTYAVWELTYHGQTGYPGEEPIDEVTEDGQYRLELSEDDMAHLIVEGFHPGEAVFEIEQWNLYLIAPDGAPHVVPGDEVFPEVTVTPRLTELDTANFGTIPVWHYTRTRTGRMPDPTQPIEECMILEESVDVWFDAATGLAVRIIRQGRDDLSACRAAGIEGEPHTADSMGDWVLDLFDTDFPVGGG